ncbi:anti-phage protein KwaA [Cytobacillus firmus]
MRNWLKIILFLSSYSPLFLIIAILHIKLNDIERVKDIIPQDKQWLIILMLVMFILPNAILFYLINRVRSFQPIREKTNSFVNKNSDVMNYIVTYLIPFLSFDFDKLNQTIAFAILIFVLGIVYIHSEIFYINPILILMGYKIYEINDKYLVITKLIVKRDKKLKLSRIHDNVYIGDEDGSNN